MENGQYYCPSPRKSCTKYAQIPTKLILLSPHSSNEIKSEIHISYLNHSMYFFIDTLLSAVALEKFNQIHSREKY